jgi:hypothetical protein
MLLWTLHVVVPTGTERVEVGDAVDAEHHGLAIDDKLRRACRTCALRKPLARSMRSIFALGGLV